MDNKKYKKIWRDETAMVPPDIGTKMADHVGRADGELMKYLRHHADVQEKELALRANKVLYDLAQSRCVSLWKLCFSVLPRWETSEPDLDVGWKETGDFTMNIDYDLRLIPVVIDWEHVEGYWEKRYNALKEKTERLIKLIEETRAVMLDVEEGL